MEKLIAHRGLKKGKIKENTIEAFKEALNNPNYIGFECDIRTTKDHIFVINHNSFYNSKIINNTLYKDLKLPKLQDVLNLPSEKIFLLEIKESTINCEQLHKLLKKYNQKKIYITSFHNQIIKKLAPYPKKYKIGCLNYLLNSEKDYQNYDFICLLETFYTDKIANYFLSQNIEIFLYGIHKEKSYKIPNVYFITDKIVESSNFF